MASDITHSAAQAVVEAASVEFFGNATLLLRLDGCTLLTDPSFLSAGDHVSVDGVVLSHVDGDHWDPPAEAAVDRDLPIVTTLQAAQILRLRGFQRALPLKVWETTSLPEQRPSAMITAVPDGHVIESTHGSGEALKIYVGGKSVRYDAIREAPRRFPGIDVAFLRVGSKKLSSPKFGVMVTLDAHGVVELVRVLEPNEDFIAAMREQGLEDRLQTIARGDRVPL